MLVFRDLTELKKDGICVPDSLTAQALPIMVAVTPLCWRSA